MPTTNESICPEEHCTGCAACANACPVRCIRMEEDGYGELHPQIDVTRCIKCGLCERTCPVQHPPCFRTPLSVHAVWNTDPIGRRFCASAGIGTLLARQVVEQQGGIAWGTRYDENGDAVTAAAETVQELPAFSGSKYVQSTVTNDTFRRVKAQIETGRAVLFTGTPCQVAGLLGVLRKDYDNLLTVDVICHGTCPMRYLREEVAHQRSKHHLPRITDVRFRGNDGNDFVFTLWSGTRLLLRQPQASSYYFSGFLQGVTRRTSCLTCPFARPERISDITIGDFIGLDPEVLARHPRQGNVSSGFLNTAKGRSAYSALLRQYPVLRDEPRDYAERLAYGPSLRYPFPASPLTDEFRRHLRNHDFPYAIRTVLRPQVQKVRRKEQRHRLLAPLTLFYRLPRKMVRLLLSHFRPRPPA